MTADGQRVEPSVEVKATRFDVDVTDVLKRYKIPVTMQGGDDAASGAEYQRLNDLPDDAKRELERYGVIDWNAGSGAEGKPHASAHWQAHITFYWFQTFPAGRTIEVTHRYHPVPRHFFFTKLQIIDELGYLPSAASCGPSREVPGRAAYQRTFQHPEQSEQILPTV